MTFPATTSTVNHDELVFAGDSSDESLEVLEVRPMAGYWVTAGARFCYYLRRFQRRLFGPLMGPVYALIQCTAWALDRLHRVDSDAWNYLLVARRPERAP